MWNLSLVMSECSLSGRGQGHVSNFYIVDWENFATASRRYTGDTHNLVRGRFVYDTYKTTEATRSRHGWLHVFITLWPTLTLQLHNFDLFMIWRTSSFCTVAWQLARLQLARRIARSLGDNWASCTSCSKFNIVLLQRWTTFFRLLFCLHTGVIIVGKLLLCFLCTSTKNNNLDMKLSCRETAPNIILKQIWLIIMHSPVL